MMVEKQNLFFYQCILHYFNIVRVCMEIEKHYFQAIGHNVA